MLSLMALEENLALLRLTLGVSWQSLAILGLEMRHAGHMGIFPLYIALCPNFPSIRTAVVLD